MTLFSLPQAAERLGQTYDRVYYAVITHKIKPYHAGRSRLLTEQDIETLQRLFAERDTNEHDHAVRQA
jgi:hypothetical protein